MKSKTRRHVRSQRLAAAIARDDPFEAEVEKGPGFGRVLFVCMILHAVAIGGFAAYKWIHPDAADPAPQKEETVKPGPPEKRAEKSGWIEPVEIVHPSIPGYVSRRVGTGETLVVIVRQFGASVAEVEKINELKPGEPLAAGRWISIPDNRKRQGQGPGKESQKTIIPKKIGENGETEPVVARPKAPEPPNPPQPSTPPPGSEGRTYRVVKGDTAYSIARRHGVVLQELLGINGLKEPRQLQVGQVLRIP
jgi:LysM repeat protein